MARLRSTRESLLRAQRAIEAHFAYQDQMNITAAGRESSALRDDAIQISREGRREEALDLFRQAAELHAPDDRSAAAAAAFYDLAEATTNDTSTSRREALLTALELLDRAASSPARKRDPLRHALTIDCRARTQRELLLSFHYHGPDGRDALERSIIRDQVEACRLCSEAGPAGWKSASSYFTNLGNTFGQLGHLDEAVGAHREAVRHLKAHEQAPDGFKQFAETVTPGPHHPEVQLASGLLRRGGPPDISEAVKLTDRLLRLPKNQRPALLLETAIRAQLATDTAESRARADQLIDELIPTATDGATALRTALFLRNLERSSDAVRLAQRAVHLFLQQRVHAVAEHNAAWHTKNAQEASVLAARLHLEADRPLQAFLALEESNGLAYHDAVALQAAGTDDPVALHLLLEAGKLGQLSGWLDDLAGRCAHAPDIGALQDELRPVVAKIAESLREDPPVAQQIAEQLPSVTTTSAPASKLRELAERARQESFRLRQAYERQDPSIEARTQGAIARPSETSLRTIFADQPDQVLIHAHVQGDWFLSVAVWLNDDQLHARALQRNLDRALVLELMEHLEPSTAVPTTSPQLLHALSLDELLEAANQPHVVLLPSGLAAFVPWAATGTTHPLIQQVTSLTSLPSLSRLLARQYQSRPRSGTVVAVPSGGDEASATSFHGLAFSEAAHNETRLIGNEATVDAVHAAARSADVLTFFAHGTAGGLGDGAIQLADGPLEILDHTSDFHGLERVELWACETGVNVSGDYLTPTGVSDGFGLDIAFHRMGARSTIGSLWKVPDLVTALLVREYRRALSRGERAVDALATAQRWWLDTGRERLRDALRRCPANPRPDELARHLGDALALHLTPDQVDALAAELGPVSASEPLDSADVDRLMARFAHAGAWAGLRFVGVCGQRPLHEREGDLPTLTEEQNTQLQSILENAYPVADPNEDPDVLVEARILALHEAVESRHPTPEEALEAARLLQFHRIGSQVDNLLWAAAWLHEALADETLSDTDRTALATEACWVWLAYGRGEANHPAIASLEARETAAVRLAALRPHLAAPQGALVDAWTRLLRCTGLAAARALAPTSSQLQSALDNATDHQSIQQAVWTAELAVCSRTKDASDAPGSTWYGPLVDWVNSSEAMLERWLRSCSLGRLQLRVAILQQLAGRPELTPPELLYLPHLDVGRAVTWTIRHQAHVGETLEEGPQDLGNDALNLIEAQHWGYEEDNSPDAVVSTGLPSAPWRFLVDTFMGQRAHATGPDEVPVEVMTAIHFGTDLRLGMRCGLARLMNISANAEGPVRPLWVAMDRLAAGSQRLRDAAQHRDLKSTCLAQGDAFHAPIAGLKAAAQASRDAVILWDLACSVETVDTPGWRRTAAFKAAIERAAMVKLAREAHDLCRATLAKGIEVQSQRHHEATDNENRLALGVLNALRNALVPRAIVNHARDSLRNLPHDTCFVSLSTDGRGALLMTGLAGGTHGHRGAWVGPDNSAFQLAQMLTTLLAAELQDDSRDRAVQSKIASWQAITALLQPGLDTVLPPPGPLAPRHIEILTPGPWRILPWTLLPTGHGPLCARFASVSHLPHLGFGVDASFPASYSSRKLTTAVLLGTSETPAPASHALVRHHRSTLPDATVLDGSRASGMQELPELRKLQAVAASTKHLVLFSTEDDTALYRSTEPVTLHAGQGITSRNLDNLPLPACALVELWGGVTRRADLLALQHWDEDAMPAMVRQFLSAGSRGVLDLAWPIPDLVKALAFEQIHLRIVNGGKVAESISAGVAATLTVLDALRTAESWGPVDKTRRRALKSAGIPRSRVPSLAELDLSLPTLAEREHLCQPVHLASIRFWGS